jgi:ferrous iron transport protein A
MDNNKDKTSLIDMKDGQAGIIISILGGRRVTKRLADLGLTSGTEIKVLRRTLFSGPIQIEVCNSRLVLGRGLALKILVELK